MNMPMPNLISFAFVDPTMFLSTMTLKYGKHFTDAQYTFDPGIKHIALRGSLNEGDEQQTDLPLLKEWPSAQALIDSAANMITTHLAAENLQLGQVYVESIPPGGFTSWRAAASAYDKKHHRFKMLASPCSGGCWFVGGDSLAPGVGNLTYLNHLALHSAINLGPVPQISLIIDVRRPPLQ